jgi:hypothetical protein
MVEKFMENVPKYEGELEEIKNSLIKSFKKRNMKPVCLQSITEYKEPFIIKKIGKVQLQITLSTKIMES